MKTRPLSFWKRQIGMPCILQDKICTEGIITGVNFTHVGEVTTVYFEATTGERIPVDISLIEHLFLYKRSFKDLLTPLPYNPNTNPLFEFISISSYGQKPENIFLIEHGKPDDKFIHNDHRQYYLTGFNNIHTSYKIKLFEDWTIHHLDDVQLPNIKDGFVFLEENGFNIDLYENIIPYD